MTPAQFGALMDADPLLQSGTETESLPTGTIDDLRAFAGMRRG